VDEIGDVVEVAEAEFEPAPPTLPDGARALIRGIYKLRAQLLLILDTEKIILPDSDEAPLTGRALSQHPSQGAGQGEPVS
jgi:chemotaxis signal transduction protein